MIYSDYKKYKKYGGNFLGIILFTQGFWAIIQYRVSSYVYKNINVFGIRHFILGICLIWQKFIEITTGISIPASVEIGHSFYIGHFGNIILNAQCKIGNNCNISQGVTIGISGRGKYRGVPIIGDHVYIGANATVVGKILIENNSVIGANSLVINNVPAGVTVVGVPAQVYNSNDSTGLI